MQGQSADVQKGLQIIARYDEVLCDKAPKHTLLELREEVNLSVKDIEKLAEKVNDKYMHSLVEM